MADSLEMTTLGGDASGVWKLCIRVTRRAERRVRLCRRDGRQSHVLPGVQWHYRARRGRANYV